MGQLGAAAVVIGHQRLDLGGQGRRPTRQGAQVGQNCGLLAPLGETRGRP